MGLSTSGVAAKLERGLGGEVGDTAGLIFALMPPRVALADHSLTFHVCQVFHDMVLIPRIRAKVLFEHLGLGAKDAEGDP